MSRPKTDEWGTKRWYDSKGRHHRINGPAVERIDGKIIWCKHGKLHRLNGPAVEWHDIEWWIESKQYTKEQYLKEVAKYISKKKLFILRLKYE